MSSNDRDFGNLDATALAALVRKREVSPLELVDDAIRPCEQVNGTLNADHTPSEVTAHRLGCTLVDRVEDSTEIDLPVLARVPELSPRE